MVARHWYSATPLTVMLVRVAVTECAEHASMPSRPYLSRPLVRERSVPQFTVAPAPTTSVRYGYRVSWGVYATAAGGNTRAQSKAVAVIRCFVSRPYARCGPPPTRGLVTFLPPKGDPGTQQQTQARNQEKRHRAQQRNAVVHTRGSRLTGVELSRLE